MQKKANTINNVNVDYIIVFTYGRDRTISRKCDFQIQITRLSRDI